MTGKIYEGDPEKMKQARAGHAIYERSTDSGSGLPSEVEQMSEAEFAAWQRQQLDPSFKARQAQAKQTAEARAKLKGDADDIGVEVDELEAARRYGMEPHEYVAFSGRVTPERAKAIEAEGRARAEAEAEARRQALVAEEAKRLK